MSAENTGALAGVKVIDLSRVLGGPYATQILGDHGAEVIKVEPPGSGDPVRRWRVVDEGTSLWWRSLARNKKCVTLDLRKPRGRELARRLALASDVLIENFRPGTMERWGLGPDELHREHPGLVYARVSGFGQTGPRSHQPGFAAVCEAVGGLRYVTGHPGEPPVRANLSLGDSLAGLHNALGILLALRARDRDGTGQVVDVAISEAVFAMLESAVPEYDRCGVVREPAGTTITGVVPSNIYPCRDGHAVVIGANGDSMYRRLMETLDRPDLANDPTLRTNDGRVGRQAELDEAIAAWTSVRDSSEVLAAMEAAAVAAGPIQSVADLFADPHFRARGLFEEVPVGGRLLALPAVVPKLAATPGATLWAGPELGEHNREVFGSLLGLGDTELAELAAAGVI